MEGLSPSVKLLLSVKYGCDRGDSVRVSLKRHLQNNHDDLSQLVAQWLQCRELGQKEANFFQSIESSHRRALILIIGQGLDGQAIYQQLLSLEEELLLACKAEVEIFVAQLPFKMLVPLLLLQFPAYLLLLLGPMLHHFLKF